MHTTEGWLYLFVAIDRTTKFAFVALHERATRRVAGDFLRHLIAAVPYRVHTVLTDNGTHFTTPGNVASAAPLIKEAIAAGETFRAHSFEAACARNGVEHRLTKPRHPWTNGRVERMNRTMEATVRRYHYDGHAQSYERIWPTSSPPTTTAAASSPCAGSPRSRRSAKHGQPSPLGSGSTRSTKCRD